MASQIYLSYQYLIPRLFGWILLFVAAIVDGIRHRSVKSRAWQLNRAVVVVIFAYVVQDILLFIYAGQPTSVVFNAFIFFTDLADGLFMALLLAIAAGFCITRENLGPHAPKVVIISVAYFITSLIMDYIMYKLLGDAYFVAGEQTTLDPETSLSEWESTLLFVSAFVHIFALLLGWLYIFDTVTRERELPEGRPGDREAPADPEAGVRQAPGAAGAADGGTDSPSAGHPVSVPGQAFLEEGQNTSHIYDEVTVEDADAARTVEEKLAHRSKLRLMRQFSWCVGAYVIATAVVILLPAFTTDPDPATQADSAATKAQRIVLVMQNVVLWVFLAGLCWIFRLREDNPYLMLDEDDQPEHSPANIT